MISVCSFVPVGVGVVIRWTRHDPETVIILNWCPLSMECFLLRDGSLDVSDVLVLAVVGHEVVHWWWRWWRGWWAGPAMSQSLLSQADAPFGVRNIMIFAIMRDKVVSRMRPWLCWCPGEKRISAGVFGDADSVDACCERDDSNGFHVI